MFLFFGEMREPYNIASFTLCKVDNYILNY